ncbi:MAG: hypothetical protein NTU51_05875 [Bacteroidetes bacterium]|nr:hypothetical protein [Bacteroidota bacterium]
MWNFSLYKLIQILLPFRRRTPRFIAWAKVFVSDLVMIHNRLMQLRQRALTEARMTPQVCYLEKFLNERWGTTEIRIVEGYELGPWVWHGVPPSGEVDLFMYEPDNYVYSNNDEVTVDFVVKVPSALSDFCNVIAADVNKFKLFSKVFIIQLI